MMLGYNLVAHYQRWKLKSLIEIVLDIGSANVVPVGTASYFDTA